MWSIHMGWQCLNSHKTASFRTSDAALEINFQIPTFFIWTIERHLTAGAETAINSQCPHLFHLHITLIHNYQNKYTQLPTTAVTGMMTFTFIFFHQNFLLSFPALASNCDAPACNASAPQHHKHWCTSLLTYMKYEITKFWRPQKNHKLTV